MADDVDAIYLDCAATTPVDPRVADIVTRFMIDEFGNAGSRTHSFGSRAKTAAEDARQLVADVVNADSAEVIFTSGATEADNIAILGLASHGENNGRTHIVSTAIEHKAVLEPLDRLAKRGFEVDLLTPNSDGRVDAAKVHDAIRNDTLLVSVMHVNNETGVVQPIGEIADLLGDHPAYLHVDAAQGFGKELDELRHPRVDLIAASGHKLYAPMGIGALIVRRRGRERPPLEPLVVGGGQERGLRPGTLPVPLAVGFGEAARLALLEHADRRHACETFRASLLDGLAALAPIINGNPSHCVPHILNLSFPGIDAEAAMLVLKDLVAISNGSACTSATYAPSHVLQAMGLSENSTREALRFSWSADTRQPDWQAVVSALTLLS